VTASAARRTEIVDRMADFVLDQGLSAASLRPLARAAGLSDRMLLYHFRDKAEVIAAVLERVAGRLAGLLAAGVAPEPMPLAALQDRLAAAVRDPALWPYMRVWLEVAAAAAGGDGLCRRVGEDIARGFLAWGAAQLDSPDAAARSRDAARLLVTVEGIVLLHSLGLADVCDTALRGAHP
jgi:AcrR family transcriptional regulator